MEHDPARRNSLLRFTEFCKAIDRDKNRLNKKNKAPIATQNDCQIIPVGLMLAPSSMQWN
jgi:hypothetical protein